MDMDVHVARVSISLPNSLKAELEPIKDGINISQLCQEALEQPVAAYQRFANRNGSDLDFDALVHGSGGRGIYSEEKLATG